MNASKSDNTSADKTRPAHAPVDNDQYSQYLLHTRNEILFVLRSLAAGTDHITIHFNDGKDFLLSTVIEVNDESITLDYGGNPELNQKALAADRHFCVTTHDKIRIQFALGKLRQIDHQGRPAFRAALPDAVLRLQRREYYRLTTPVANPIKCQIPVKREGGLGPTILEACIVDISGGGLAMMTPPAGLVFGIGSTFEDCRIELPDVGTIIADLEVRNLFEITLRSGARVHRAGCQFAKLPGPMLTLIQRYIIKVERERKAREAGMS